MNSQIKPRVNWQFANMYFHLASSLPGYCADFRTEPPQGLPLSSGESPAKSSALTTVRRAEVFGKHRV